MNEVERLAEALRRANSELEVKSDELSDAVGHARKRLLGRLLAVAALSAVGAMLLLGGGLAASKAVKTAGENQSGGDEGQKGSGEPQRQTGNLKEARGNSSGDNGSHGQGGGDSHPQEARKQIQPNVDSGKGTNGGFTAEDQPNLRVIELTPTEIEVVNDGAKRSGKFVVMVWVESEEGAGRKEPLEFETLAAGESATKTFALTCEVGSIVAEIDPEKSVKESEEDDNKESEKCEPPADAVEEGKEKTPTGEEEKAESANSSGTASPSTQEP